MQQTVLTVPVQPAPALINTTPSSRMNIAVIRGLGITQIIFGVLSVIFGIVTASAISEFWVNNSGSGIWFGLWITVTGIIGVFSARQPASKALNGTNMGFNIVCTVISFFVGIFFAIGVGYFNECDEFRAVYNYDYYVYSRSSSYYTYVRNNNCRNKDAGIAVYSILMVIMIAEFFVSLTISIYCCQGSGCCGTETTGVIIQQQPTAYQITTSSTGVYPQVSYPQTSYPSSSYPAQVAYPNQPAMVSQPPMGAYTTPTYSTDQKSPPPPAYVQ